MVEHLPNMDKILGLIPNNIESRIGEERGREAVKGEKRKRKGEGKEKEGKTEKEGKRREETGGDGKLCLIKYGATCL